MKTGAGVRLVLSIFCVLAVFPHANTWSGDDESVFLDGFESRAYVLHLPFDGDTTDQSTFGTDGINSGATLTTDRNGNPDSAYYFNDGGAQIYVPDTESLDVSELTLSFWFSLLSPETARELVNKLGSEGNISYGAEYQAGSGKIYFRVCTDGTLATLTDLGSETTISTGTWYHFTGTYDGTEMKIYINGSPDTSTAKTGAIFNSTEPLRVGRYGFWHGWDFHGSIDEVVVWDRSLSAAEVAALYANGGKP